MMSAIESSRIGVQRPARARSRRAAPGGNWPKPDQPLPGAQRQRADVHSRELPAAAVDPNLSVWRIHGRIGMSCGPFSNQLLRETGLEISSERVERLRQAHAAAYRRKADGVRLSPPKISSELT